MRNLMRTLSCLLTGILCAALLAGCFGSGTDSEDAADDKVDTAAAAQEDAGTEDEDTKTSADYTTLTVSTYTVDDSGNQALYSTLIYDHDGNFLEGHYIYDTDTASDADVATALESRSTYSYDENGLISDYSHYQVNYLGGEESVEEFTAYFNYGYDENGNVTSISAEYELDSDDGELAADYALLSYNTEGNVSSLYFNDTYGYSDEEINEQIGSDDMTEGVLLEFSYSFDEIDGYSIFYDSDDEAVRVIEYDENGMVSGIAYGHCDGYGFVYDYLWYSVLKYIDSIQESGLARYSDYLRMYYSNYFYKFEYDSQGNLISRKLYDCAEYYEEEDLQYSYTYEYEYNEYGLISTRYIYLDGEADSISYYEYE